MAIQLTDQEQARLSHRRQFALTRREWRKELLSLAKTSLKAAAKPERKQLRKIKKLAKAELRLASLARSRKAR